MFWGYFSSVCQEYFLDGGMKRMLEKDEKSARLAMAMSATALSDQPYSSSIPRYCIVTVLNQTCPFLADYFALCQRALLCVHIDTSYLY